MTLSTIISRLRTDTRLSFQYYQSLRFGLIVLTTIILVKLGFSQDEMSMFEWIFFISNAVSFFWAAGLVTGFLSYAPNLEKQKLPILTKSLMTFYAVGAIGTSIILGAGDIVGFYELGVYRLQILLYLIFNISSSIVVGTFLIKEKAQTIFNYGTISYILYPLVILGFYFGFDQSLTDIINGLVVWSGLRFLYFLYCYIQEQATPQWKILVPFLMFSIPLVLKVVLGQGMPYIDGFLVAHFFEDHFFAIYRYGARELPINTILITALVSSSIPYAVKNLQASNQDIKRRTKRLMHWLFPLSIVLIFSSEYLFTFFYSSEYEISAEIFNIHLLLICSRFVVPQLSFYALHKNKELLYIAIIEVLTNIVLSIIFLKYMGILGIAYATLIAFTLQKVIMVIMNKYKYSIKLKEYLDINTFLVYSAIIIFSFLINHLWF